ncbi:class I SAM-dependent methyltransferase [Amycolatopsis lexingtonensis]|uniref:class I SAM-dependent methyltransferase n=1 Tax=Amycolatopsis lexingtonensis TaxID=218822 RepID=UPI003F71A3CC
MSYEHPLAYLLGVEGLALLRGFTGEFDREFTEARIAEVRRLLDDESLADGVEVERLDTVAGYDLWAGTYDDPANAAFALDEPLLEEIIGTLPPGDALDAACGTGRYSRILTRRGHRVIGVDSSPAMLAQARDGDFRLGDLTALPVADASVDLVTCGLALTHVADLGPVLAEFARVLRPGGHAVLCDVHPESVARGSIPSLRGPGGRPGRLASHRHLVGDYLRAALAAGLTALRCEEPCPPPKGAVPATTGPGPWELWPWSLAALVPDAARAAGRGVPALLVWDFQLPEM